MCRTRRARRTRPQSAVRSRAIDIDHCRIIDVYYEEVEARRPKGLVELRTSNLRVSRQLGLGTSTQSVTDRQDPV